LPLPICSYDAETGRSVWERPDDLDAPQPARQSPSLRSCLATDPRVRSLTGAILSRCGLEAVPHVRLAGADEPLCSDGRGGAFCCASNRIYLCSETAWVSCRALLLAQPLLHRPSAAHPALAITTVSRLPHLAGELAYELSHAYNTCTGVTRCAPGGVIQDGQRCGYLSPPHLACSELRAAYWTGRCADRTGDDLRRCLEYHAEWAVSACFPTDPHAHAHVRWATSKCMPEGRDIDLTRVGNGQADRGSGAKT